MYRDTNFLYWCYSLFLGALLLLLHSGEGSEDSITFVRVMNVSVIIVLGIQIPVLR